MREHVHVYVYAPCSERVKYLKGRLGVEEAEGVREADADAVDDGLGMGRRGQWRRGEVDLVLW